MSLQCKAVTAKGEPCGSPSHLIDPHTLYCRWHDPAHKEELREQARRGGKASAERFKMQGLQPDDLGQLRDPEDVRRWLEKAGQAVAAGQLSASAGAVLVRSCEAVLKALDAGSLKDEIADLRGKLAEFRKLRAS